MAFCNQIFNGGPLNRSLAPIRITGATGPQGPAGPQGPTGPTGPSAVTSFGGLSNGSFTTVDADDTAYTQILLSLTLPALDITYSGASMIVANAGTYLVNYSVILTSDFAGDVSVAVRMNGFALPQTEQTISLEANVPATFSSSMILTLAAGSVLDLAALSNAGEGGSTLSIPAGNATITVLQLA